jgi:uncharacterized protein (TIGR02147 family)
MKQLGRKTIKEIVEQCDVFGFMSVQELLAHIYSERKKETKPYSYRMFSSELGFGESNYMHLICTQRRQLSLRSAHTVASRLGLHGERRTWFLSLVEHTAGRDQAQRSEGIEKAYAARRKTLASELSRDEMEFFGKWYHSVIRELAASEEFSPDPKWICQQLRPRITVEQAKHSLELQLRLGYLQFDENLQRVIIPQSHIRVPEGVTNLAIHKFHQEMLQLSERSLSEIEAYERDLSAVTLHLNGEQINAVKEILREARKKIVALSEGLNCSDGAAVFQLNMQLFPVSEFSRGQRK